MTMSLIGPTCFTALILSLILFKYLPCFLFTAAEIDEKTHNDDEGTSSSRLAIFGRPKRHLPGLKSKNVSHETKQHKLAKTSFNKDSHSLNKRLQSLSNNSTTDETPSSSLSSPSSSLPTSASTTAENEAARRASTFHDPPSNSERTTDPGRFRMSQPSSSRLMPPPSSNRPLRTAQLGSSLTANRIPASGSSLAPKATGLISPNAAVKSSNSSNRRKVVLQPGHSPLDWATLTKSGKNMSGVDGLQKVTPSQLAYHNGRKGRPAWSSWQGKVYNITPYLPFHPGGVDELRRAAGKGADKLFLEVHPWVNWENMLEECLVGILVTEEAVPTQNSQQNARQAGRSSSLEDMD